MDPILILVIVCCLCIFSSIIAGIAAFFINQSSAKAPTKTAGGNTTTRTNPATATNTNPTATNPTATNPTTTNPTPIVAPVTCALAKQDYLARYKDVKDSGGDAWTHYKTAGKKEGRTWNGPYCDIYWNCYRNTDLKRIDAYNDDGFGGGLMNLTKSDASNTCNDYLSDCGNSGGCTAYLANTKPDYIPTRLYKCPGNPDLYRYELGKFKFIRPEYLYTWYDTLPIPIEISCEELSKIKGIEMGRGNIIPKISDIFVHGQTYSCDNQGMWRFERDDSGLNPRKRLYPTQEIFRSWVTTTHYTPVTCDDLNKVTTGEPMALKEYKQLKNKYNKCLSVGSQKGDNITVEACDPANKGQNWKLENANLKNQNNYCANNKGGGYGKDTQLIQWDCDNTEWSKWETSSLTNSDNYVYYASQNSREKNNGNFHMVAGTKDNGASQENAIVLGEPANNDGQKWIWN
jgi:Ricin-type beta-trefoil lectin domain